MAILALLAYKGIKHLGGSQQQPAPGGNPQRLPGNNPMNTSAPNGGGGLGDILGGLLGGGVAAPGGWWPRCWRRRLGGLLKGGLGGLLAGGAAGSILSGGLGGLLKQFQQNGQGEVAKSWVSRGPNQDISESDLAKSIGSEDIDALSQHTGLSRDELLSGLQPRTARRDRRVDAGRPRADRRRGLALGVRRPQLGCETEKPWRCLPGFFVSSTGDVAGRGFQRQAGISFPPTAPFAAAPA